MKIRRRSSTWFNWGLGGAFFPLFSIQRGVQEGLFHMAEIEEDLSVDYDLIFLKDRRSSNMVRIFTSTMKRLQQDLCEVTGEAPTGSDR